jgi:hypothetical protein
MRHEEVAPVSYQRESASTRWTIGKLGRAVLGGFLALSVIWMGAAAVKASRSSRASSRPARHSVRPRLSPRYDPAKFTPRIDNAWYPLRPGITYVYRGVEGAKRSRDVLEVTGEVVAIAGVRCRVIKDKVYLNGRLEERTRDYYTQDEDGNVWYFGEDTAELDENGNVISTEGSWRTGRNGAEAGIFMEANPQVGHTYQQEFYRHHAEDHYEVLSLTAEIKVPYGRFGGNKLKRSVELTKEWTPLEPEVIDHKYYVRGIGQVKEVTAKGRPLESLELVNIVRS